MPPLLCAVHPVRLFSRIMFPGRGGVRFTLLVATPQWSQRVVEMTIGTLELLGIFTTVLCAH